MDLKTMVSNLTESSEYGIVACCNGDGLAVAAKGEFPVIAYLLARVIYACHKDNGIPLDEFGHTLNLAMKSIIEAEEEDEE